VTTTGSGKDHPGLAISVYRVDPKTKVRTPVKACVLPAVESLPFSIAYPPCACPRCSEASSQ